MKITFCVVAAGTYCTINDGRVETTVRLSNGTKRVARDLQDLADMEQVAIENATKRRDRLNHAAQQYARELQLAEGIAAELKAEG